MQTVPCRRIRFACFLSRTPPSTMSSAPFHQGLGEAGGGAGALLVAVVERRGGAPAVRDQFVDADRGSTDAAAGKPSFWSSPVTVRNAVRSGVV